MADDYVPIPTYPFAEIVTVILSDEDGEVGRIDGPVWLPAGSVIELGKPNRDYTVLDCRFQMSGDGRSSTVIVTVDHAKPGDMIPRDPTRRLLEP